MKEFSQYLTEESAPKPDRVLTFNNRVLILGFGSVARVFLPILLRHVKVSPKDITILDMQDRTPELKDWLKAGIKFVQKKLTEENLIETIAELRKDGDMIVDLTYNVSCYVLLDFCHEHKNLYLNSAVEEWGLEEGVIDTRNTYDKTLYSRHMKIKEVIKKWKDANEGPTAILDCGANPGLISHFTKKALIDIARTKLNEKSNKKLKDLIYAAVEKNEFGNLAMELGVKVIHCAERDTQITKQPKAVGEYVGTWSIAGIFEEGNAPAELGWGIHEPEFEGLPYTEAKSGPKNQIFLHQSGINTFVRSYVPGVGEICGMLIRHGEAFTISRHLTVEKNGKVIYRPTCHYSYVPCNETLASLADIRSSNYKPIDVKDERIMYDEIINGADTLGALVMGYDDDKSWFVGTSLDIEEARRLVPGKNTTNATNIQVAAGLIGAAVWMIENPNKGVKVPDDLPFMKMLKIAKPYLGKLISQECDWTPLKNFTNRFPERKDNEPDLKNPWCFHNFLFKS